MSLRCAWCSRNLGYVHGHAACLHNGCAMYGVNQAECCSGEVCVPATSSIGRAPVPGGETHGRASREATVTRRVPNKRS